MSNASQESKSRFQMGVAMVVGVGVAKEEEVEEQGEEVVAEVEGEPKVIPAAEKERTW